MHLTNGEKGTDAGLVGGWTMRGRGKAGHTHAARGALDEQACGAGNGRDWQKAATVPFSPEVETDTSLQFDIARNRLRLHLQECPICLTDAPRCEEGFDLLQRVNDLADELRAEATVAAYGLGR